MKTGGERFSFLSLSIGDWGALEDALARVHKTCEGMPVDASLPSLRVETLTQPVLDALGRARSGSFTLAPEAGSERTRRLINKGNTDEDLYASAEKVFASGWHAIKLYFMLGLPGETDEDIDGIVAIANRCLDIGRKHHRRPDVTVSTSTFVPKAHTPLQWEAQISIDEVERRQRILKKRLRRPGLAYRWHDARMSFLEGVFARGGRELADAIEIAFAAGARFDAWDESFDCERWSEAFAKAGIAPESYLEERDRDAPLPWDHLGVGPSRAFLLQERERAFALESTPDCTTGACSNCGMCDFDEVKNRVVRPVILSEAKDPMESTGSFDASAPQDDGSAGEGAGKRFRYRIRYTKTDRSAFIGSREALDVLRRAFRAARLPLLYSQGYHPRVRISAGPALPVGFESDAEFIDAAFATPVEAAEIVDRLRGGLPGGMEVVEAWPLGEGAASIEEAQSLVNYEVDVRTWGADPEAAIGRFEAADGLPFVRHRGKKAVEVDLKAYVAELALAPGGMLGVSVRCQQPALKVGEILGAIFDVSEDLLRATSVRKIAVEWKGPEPQV